MPTAHFPVANLFLVRHAPDTKPPAQPAEVPTNHVLVIDCSGSMCGDLPQIRTQLKKKLPKMLRERDTISIIWFSGTGQHGVLLEAEPVATLTDLKAVEAAIDRWLRPQGLTAFEGPMNDAASVVERIAKARPGSAFSLLFLSDGCDNCSRSRADLLKAVEKASGGFQSAAFIEYGYYADRPLLTAMAERSGGCHIHAKDFDAFEPTLQASLAKQVLGGKRIEMTIAGDAVGGFVWAEDQNDLLTFAVTGDKASVPEHTGVIWYLSPTAVGTKADAYAVNAAYAAIALFSVRAKPDVVLPFLKLTGDVAFISKFGGLFGRQKYSEFMDAAKAACFDPTKRLTEGYNPALIPAEDAFTVLDMLRLLAEDDENRVLLDHPGFRYSRIGRARLDASSVLTDEEQAEVTRLTAEMAKTKVAAKVRELSDKIAAISNKPAPLRFEPTPIPDGVPVSSLTYNEQNPNVSMLVRREGTVDLSKHVPENLRGTLPERFPTFIFRNYAIVKDGLVNVRVLPVRLSAKTLATLFAETKAGRIPGDIITVDGPTTLINFEALPVINRRMVRTMSARTLFENEWALTKVQAAQKVYTSVLKEVGGGKKSQGYVDQYGAEAATWLKDAGLTEYSGFGPKQVQAESTDFYMAKELKIAIKSFSSIPSLNDWKKQAAKGKFTPSAALMTDAYQAIEAQMATPEGKDMAALETWLRAEQKRLDQQRRQMLADKAQTVFCVTVGQSWFEEFSTVAEGSLTLDLDGQKLECRVEQTEVQVKI